ncbi:MAG: prolyl oligopeptidase family serine peptidase [Bacteriovoracaceae bacterium]|jgi:protease II|nr:hypothetical protein [Halobacteriovoraceae bacterium]MDP7321216.1 prolyl oligopeptidase family serine peptidase [Bacteriovoracaceae bacterium]
MLIFLRLLTCSTIFISSFAVYAIEYRWLEILRYPDSRFYTQYTQEQKTWLEQQDLIRDNYLDTLRQSSVEKEIEDYWSKKRVLKKLSLDESSYVELGLSEQSQSFKVVYVNLKDESKKRLILNTNQAYEINGCPNCTVRNIKLSPTKKYLILEILPFHQTTYADLYFYDLNDLNADPLKVENTFLNFLSWDSEDSFLYRRVESLSLSFKFDLLSGQNFMTSGLVENFKVVGETPYQYSVSSSREYNDEEVIVKNILKFKKYNSNSAQEFNLGHLFDNKNIQINDLFFLANTESSFVLSTDNTIHEKIFFISLDKKKDNRVKIKTVNLFNAPKDGAIQKMFALKNKYLGVYLSGTEKYYYLFNSNGEVISKLKAPQASLDMISQNEEKRLRFTYSSEVNENIQIEFLSSELGQLNADSIDARLYTDQTGNQYTYSFEWAKSKDGTMVPIKLLHLKDLVIDKRSPLYILAYGGHGIVTYFFPRYEIGMHIYLQQGGVFATPAVRGGGEFGKNWYTQVFGSLARYEDTLAAVSKLHSMNIGSPQTTGFEGWSNGGLLAGVMLTMAPEMFKLIICGNGLADMERKDVLEGPFVWSDEFGNNRSLSAVEYLRSYSPAYNAKKKRKYPVVYTMVGENDLRVNPSHSYKLTAILQDYQVGLNPVVLDRYSNTGHWITKPSSAKSFAIVSLKRKWRVIFNELGLINQF